VCVCVRVCWAYVEGGGSSRAVTRLHTMIGLTGYRTRDIQRIRRALYRRTKKAQLTFVATYHICTKLRHLCSCVSIFYAPITLITQPKGHRVDGCERISSTHVQHINCRLCGPYCGSMR
jgi:hypothetical protein